MSCPRLNEGTAASVSGLRSAEREVLLGQHAFGGATCRRRTAPEELLWYALAVKLGGADRTQFRFRLEKTLWYFIVKESVGGTSMFCVVSRWSLRRHKVPSGPHTRGRKTCECAQFFVSFRGSAQNGVTPKWTAPLNWHTRDGHTFRERKREWRNESDIPGSSSAWLSSA